MMRVDSPTDSVLDLLRTSDPAPPSSLHGAGIEIALDEIGRGIRSRPRRRPLRRRATDRRRAALLVVAAVLVLVASVAAGAAVLGAHTGLFPSKAEEAVGGPGEALNPAAPDFRAVALQIASDIPYPAGYESWRDFIVSNEIRYADGGVESTGALHGWFAASAFCAWLQRWRQAVIAGDVNAASLAAATIGRAPRWKAVRDEDPQPDPTAPNDPGAETGTLFGWMVPYRDAVLAGNLARVEHLLANGYGDGKCWSSDPLWMAQERSHRYTRANLSRAELARTYERFLARVRP